MKKRKIKRGDALLVAGVLALAAAAFPVIEIGFRQPGVQVVVTAEGRVFGTYALKEDRQIEVVTSRGKNMIVIEQGAALMIQADCPDKICVKTGKISRTGETIVCLPHKVVVEVRGGKNQVDGVAR